MPFIKKENGSLQMCVDYGGLNQINQYLFPLILNITKKHVFLTRKIDQKNPKCHHGQLDQSVILDKSIWTWPFL
jgi:hypothetical protein